jgi:hypothetical protein
MNVLQAILSSEELDSIIRALELRANDSRHGLVGRSDRR